MLLSQIYEIFSHTYLVNESNNVLVQTFFFSRRQNDIKLYEVVLTHLINRKVITYQKP